MKRSRLGLATFFTFMGTLHFVARRSFEAIVPTSLEARKKEAVVVSGVAEIAGAAMVLHPATRRLGRWWLLGLLLSVFPANIHMAVNPEQIRGLDLNKVPRWALWARLPLQPLAMIWVWQATRG
ncbi:MAG TPA: hypothetical protein VIT89_02735 [Solirubrobacterales bacterium]